MATSSVDNLVDKYDNEIHGWERLFRDIKVISSNYDLSCTIAKQQTNRTRNRYRDVSPYDHSRVKLIDGPCDYINSSLVKVPTAKRSYILSQGPLPDTSGHLWQMVWEQNSKAVIMLNKIVEKGVRKCHQYWPINKNQPMKFDREGYNVALVEEHLQTNFVVRELEVTKLETDEKRTIYQFHYIAWPDFGVPESPTAFLDFLTCVQNYGVLDEKSCGPAVIHCSAGIGRSGTFALVDTCYVFLEHGIEFDIRDTLLEMRKYRMGLIQTAQQLRFSYLAIAECSRKLNKLSEDGSIPTTPSTLSEDESDDEDSKKDEDSPPGEPENLPPDTNGDDRWNGEPEPNQDSKDNRKRHAEDPPGSADEKRGKQENNEVETPGVSEDNNNEATTLRHRQREIKNNAIREKVEEIKKNMQKKEKRIDWKTYVIGGILAGVVVGLAVRYWYG